MIADKAIARLQGEDGAHWARFAYGAKAHAQFKLGEVAEAERLIAKAFDDVDVESTSASFTDIHETAYQIHMMRANYAEALDHHQSYKRLSDEAKKVTSTANLALLAAQFDFAEKKLNIERLKNDRLQKDMLLEDARHRVEVQRAVLAVSGLVILFSFTMAVAFRNNRNRVAKVNETLEGTICELNAEVDRRVKVERDLVAAKDEAERASRIKSTFLATMSHELRTPLNGILGFTKILLGGKLEEEQREQIDIIDQSGEALLTLINDILDLSAIEAGKLNLQPTSINLRTTIEGAVRLLKAKAEEKNLALAVHVDPELPDHVIADGARLRQVLINLVGNAIKFTEKGSVAVVATRGETAGDVKFAVIDSGIGIPADKQHLLFDRFSQVDGSLNRKFGGTGLGLAICREIVEQMGGEIGVQSALGEGSEFYFNAPLGADDEIVPLPVNRARKLETTQRVVVVDDVAVIRKVYGMMLPALNASVEAASSGRDAIAKLIELNERGETVDVIIVNGELVDMAPQDFAQRVKRNALAEDAVFVLASPTKVADDDLSAMGFDRRIDQPISDKSVFAALTASSAPEAAPAPRAFEPSEGVSNVVSLVTAPVDARVLVVDDNETNRKLIAATLKSLRVAVDEAENGREAVAAAANADYSAILMDLQMPVMNGAEATRAIRGGCPRNAKTPIIAITAADSFDEMEEVSAAGMDDVMTKPVNPARLRAKIEECVAAAVVTEDAPTDEQRGGAVS